MSRDDNLRRLNAIPKGMGGTDWPIKIRLLPSPPPLTYHWHGIRGLKLSPQASKVTFQQLFSWLSVCMVVRSLIRRYMAVTVCLVVRRVGLHNAYHNHAAAVRLVSSSRITYHYCQQLQHSRTSQRAKNYILWRHFRLSLFYEIMFNLMPTPGTLRRRKSRSGWGWEWGLVLLSQVTTRATAEVPLKTAIYCIIYRTVLLYHHYKTIYVFH
jgi:hypothetical protein